METNHSSRKPEPEAGHPEEELLNPYCSEQAGGNDEKKYRLLFEDVDEGIVVLQNDKFCFTNKKMAEITDYSHDDLVSKKFPDFAHPDDRELVYNWYNRCLQGNKTNPNYPFRFITCGGEVKWVLGNSIKINWNGECAVMGFITDITPQNQTMETSADPMQLLQDLFEHCPIGAFSINLDGYVLYTNQVAAEIFGYQSSEKMISAKPLQKGQNRKNLDSLFEALKKATTIKHYSFSIKTRTGHSKTLRCDGVLHNNQVWMLIPEADECSQKKMALEQELQAQAALANAFDDWALLIDLDGRIQTINATAAEKLGGHPHDLVGLNIFSAMPSNSAIFQKTHVKKAARLKESVHFQANFEGQYYAIRINPVMDQANKVGNMAIFAKNITKQIQHDKNMLKSHTKLECKVAEQTKELKLRAGFLEDANIALEVLLKKRDEDKLNFEQKIINSVKDLVLPYVIKLDRRIADDKSKIYLSILEANLKSILSPFSHKLSSIYMLLTPSEIEVAEYIKYGKSSKEIGKMMNLSVKTVETYRAKIRQKTGLRNKKTNLRSYLLSFKNI